MKNTPEDQKIEPTDQNRADALELSKFIISMLRTAILDLLPELSKEKVSYHQYVVLTALESEGTLKMGNIAKKIGYSTAAACGMIDKLERMRLVKREHSYEDRRVVRVNITVKGSEFVTNMREKIKKTLHEIL